MTLHFIRHGDTLQSVADQINLENPVYIKEFHNENCAKEDYIITGLVVGKKLFLPDNVTVEKYNSRNDAEFKSSERNPKISFNPEKLNIKYRVVVTESNIDDGKKTENSLSYDFSLQWVKNELDIHVFYLSKYNFSNKEQTKIGDMAIACIESINPIEIHTNAKSEIIAISIVEETKKYFPERKKKLLDQFPDQYAKIYIDEFEYIVQNQELFQKKMQEDWLFKTYFAHIRNDFNNGKSYFRMILENKLIEVCQVVNVSNDGGEIILMQNSLSENVDFNGNYIVSKENGVISSLEVNYSHSLYEVLYTTRFKIDEVL